MQAVNPHLAAHTPDEALEALKKQFKAYSAGDPPFDRKRRLRESPRSWWEQLLVHEDADVLAVRYWNPFTLSKLRLALYPGHRRQNIFVDAYLNGR